MTAVGAACGYTSSAVSQQLATLEREAGVRLYERAGRRVQLTAEGHRLVRHAQAVLDAIEVAEADLRAAATPRGPLRVAAFATAAAARVLPAFATARAAYPELRLEVRELEPDDAVEALRERQCEIAVTYTYSLLPPAAPPPGLRIETLGDEPVVLALPTDHPATALGMLAEDEWIAGSRLSADHELATRVCATAGFAPRITHAADDYGLVMRMVQQAARLRAGARAGRHLLRRAGRRPAAVPAGDGPHPTHARRDQARHHRRTGSTSVRGSSAGRVVVAHPVH